MTLIIEHEVNYSINSLNNIIKQKYEGVFSSILF